MAPQAYQADEFIPYDIEGPIHANSFLNSIVVPRPIAFVTTIGPGGMINAAPFSYFNMACTNPPMLSIAIERRHGIRKDTSRNIAEVKEFVVNICSIDLAKAASIAGGDYPPETSEIDLAQLSLIPSTEISVPRIANSLAQIECILFQIIELGKDPTDLILGEIVKVHVHKSILNNQGRVDFEKLNPLARLSGSTYAKLSDYFNIARGL